MPPSASARVADVVVERSAASMVLRFSMTTSPDVIREALYSANAIGPLNAALSDAVSRSVQAHDEVGAFAGLTLVDALVGHDDRAAAGQHLVDLGHGIGRDRDPVERFGRTVGRDDRLCRDRDHGGPA